MFKRIQKRLACLTFSWEMMVGNGQVCLLLMLQILLWIPVAVSTLTGAMLIIYGIWWMLHGIYPLLIENRSTSVEIGCGVIITSACCIMALGIAMILLLIAEMDWIPRMAGIFYTLAFFVWLFVIMKTAPVVTRGLLIGVVFCVMATGYALVCNVLMVMNALVTDVSHIKTPWEQAMGYIVSGVAIVAWTLFVMRKTAPTNFKILVPVFTIGGIIYIGFGIAATLVLISR